MKKHLLFAVGCVLAGGALAQNQTMDINFGSAEAAPNLQYTPIPSSKAVWDVFTAIDVTTASAGTVGQAGVAVINGDIWTTKWASDTILRFTAGGAFIDKITIAGVSGARSLTTDGTNVYVGNASNTISIIDPNTLTMTGTINSASANPSRFLTFDPTLDGGAGGFWTGNFNTDIDAISLTGAVLTTIPAATHTLTGMYGAAFDNSNPSAPLLWVYHQAGANNSQVSVLYLQGGQPSGLTHDAFTEMSSQFGASSNLAGGAFFSTSFTPGQSSLLLLGQGTPNNGILVYDVNANFTGLDEATANEMRVYPNPSNGLVNMDLAQELSEAGTLTVVDLNGRVVYAQDLSLGTQSVSFELNGLQAGTYMMNVVSGATSMVRTLSIQ